MLRLEVIGHLGADAEKREQDGRIFYTFKVAHSEKYTSADGQSVETTQWVSCVMQEKLGAAVSQYLTKGKQVYVRGRASTRVYSSKIDRSMKAGLTCSVDELELLGGSSELVPRMLADPNTNIAYQVAKAYYIPQANVIGERPAMLIDNSGQIYGVDENLFITPPNSNTAENG